MVVVRFVHHCSNFLCCCSLLFLGCTLFSPRPAELPRSGVYLDFLGFDLITASSSVNFSGNYGVYFSDSAWYRQQRMDGVAGRNAFIVYLNSISGRFKELKVNWQPIPTHNSLSAGTTEIVDLDYLVLGVFPAASALDSIRFSGKARIMFSKDSSGTIRITQFDDQYYRPGADSLSFFNPGRG